MSGRFASLAPFLSVPAFFAVRILCAMLLLKVSALYLPVTGFSTLTQFLLLSALLNMVAIGGAQNGIIREVAAADGAAAVGRARMGAFVLWAATTCLVGVPLAALGAPVADLLIGDRQAAWAVPAIVAVAFAAGPGQIYCSILTGSGRLVASLLTQGIGLVLGTGAALALLVLREPLWAAIAFAAGPIVTMAIAWLLVRRMALPRGNPRERVTEARRLIGYSGAFLAVSVSTALVFFGLRYAYREAFGLDQLGFWLAANRISDVSTQLLGLFGSQLFVPRYTPVAGTAEGRRVALRYWTLAVVVMAAIPLAFCIAPHFLVRTFLSATYEPAIGFILAYMVGDFLRVSGSMAMNAAFARARLLLYVGIELSTVGAFAAMTLIGISLGWVRAPVIAYPIAYAASALVVIVLFLRSAARPPERAAPELP